MAALQRVPNELWAATFAYLACADLLLASGACSHWRALAFDQDLFWAHVVVDSICPQTLYWTTRRIAAGLERPFTFEIALGEEDPLVEIELLFLLQRSLSRCRDLRLTLPLVYVPEVFTMLRAPAPILEMFQMHVACAGGSPSDQLPVLPTNLFSGTPASLRDIQLTSIALPTERVPAFQLVDVAVLRVPEEAWQYLPPNFVAIFPALRQLYLYGGGLRLPEPLSSDVADVFASLELLDVAYFETENIIVFERLPTSAVHEILVAHSDAPTVRASLAQLPGPIDVIFSQASRAVRVTFVSNITGHHRTFEEQFSDFEPGAHNAAFVLSETPFLEQLECLRIASSLWDLVRSVVPRNNHLLELILHIGDHGCDAISLPTSPIACPKLEKLVLQAQGHHVVYVTAEEVVRFAGIVSETHLHLELHRVIVQGDHDVISSRFKTVQTSMRVVT